MVNCELKRRWIIEKDRVQKSGVGSFQLAMPQ